MAGTTKKKGGLGKGLGSLIPSEDVPVEGKQEIKPDTEVDIKKVEPNKEQPRKTFREDGLLELAESIKLHGIIEPLVVENKGKYYEIISGERRWRAAQLAGLKKVPIVEKNDLTPQEKKEIALIENIQREDLNPIEEAMSYKSLMEEYGLTQDQVAERVSKSRVTITNATRLLKLDKRVQQMVIDEMITQGHARALISITDKTKQYDFAQKIFDDKMSVREVEKAVKKLLLDKTTEPSKKTEGSDAQLDAIYHDIEEKLKATIGTKVAITPAKNKKAGKIEIEYYSQEELDRIVDLLKNIQ